jgi:hypothetical protein
LDEITISLLIVHPFSRGALRSRGGGDKTPYLGQAGSGSGIAIVPLEWSPEYSPGVKHISHIPYILRHIAQNQIAGTRLTAPVRAPTLLTGQKLVVPKSA